MIYFEPSPSGLRSMLGQIMWFKRQAIRWQLDYRIVIDALVEEKRGIGFKIVFEKLLRFTNKCVLKKDLPSNIICLSLQEFHNLFPSSSRHDGKNIPNYIGLFADIKIDANHLSQDYWHDH